MIPTDFTYAAPRSVAEAVGLLAADRSGVVLGGGTWAVPELNRGDVRPATVVDLRHAGLDAIALDGDIVRLGATCTYAALLDSDVVAAHLPLLRVMAGGVTGGRQILNQGTLGGSLAAALPHSDAPAVMVALGATAVIAGPRSERTVAVADLFAGAGRTVLEPGEIIVRVDVPSSRGDGVGHHKLKHSGSSWPIAIAAALVRLGSDGRCAGATLCLGAVAATPVAVDVGPALVGAVPDAAALAEAGRLAAAAVPEPWSDVLAPGDYRAAVIPVVTARALTMALADARRPGNDDEGHDA